MTGTSVMNEPSVCLQGLDVRAALDGKLTELTFPLVEQPPARFMTGDVAAIVNVRGDGKQWAIGKMPERVAWPPGALPGIRCPIGDRGDVVKVCESFLQVAVRDNHGMPRCDSAGRSLLETWYRADQTEVAYYDDDRPDNKPWRPASEMPIELSRLSLRIERVEVERLSAHHRFALLIEDVIATSVGEADRSAQLALDWERRHGRGSWESNPWIWVVKVAPVEIDVVPLFVAI